MLSARSLARVWGGGALRCGAWGGVGWGEEAWALVGRRLLGRDEGSQESYQRGAGVGVGRPLPYPMPRALPSALFPSQVQRGVLVSGPARIPGTDPQGLLPWGACPRLIFQDQTRRGGLSWGCTEAGVRVTVLGPKFMAVVGHKPLPVLSLVQQGSEGAHWEGRRRSRVSVPLTSLVRAAAEWGELGLRTPLERGPRGLPGCHGLISRPKCLLVERPGV